MFSNSTNRREELQSCNCKVLSDLNRGQQKAHICTLSLGKYAVKSLCMQLKHAPMIVQTDGQPHRHSPIAL